MSECSHATRQHDTTGGCTRSHCLDCGADLTRPTPQPEPWTRPDYITRAELVAALFSAGHALGSDSLNGYGLKNIARKLADALESKGLPVGDDMDMTTARRLHAYGKDICDEWCSPETCPYQQKTDEGGASLLSAINDAQIDHDGITMDVGNKIALRVAAKRLRGMATTGSADHTTIRDTARWLEQEADR